MSIENLEAMCIKRSKDAGLVINYASTQFGVKESDLKANFKLDNNRKVIALAQLSVVNQYLNDFQAIIKKVNQSTQDKSMNFMDFDGMHCIHHPHQIKKVNEGEKKTAEATPATEE